MNIENTKKVVFRELRRHDPDYFDAPAQPDRASALQLAVPVIEEIVANVCKSTDDSDHVALLLKIRAELAETARALLQAMQPLWEYGQPVPGNGPDGDADAGSRVFALAVAQLAKSVAGDSEPSPVLQALAKRAGVAESAQAQDARDPVNLGCVVRCRLVTVGLLLQRASACLWTAALIEPPRVNRKGLPKLRNRSVATATQAQSYLRAVQQFADTIAALDLDVASLPVGEDAVGEAAALCIVRDFTLRRHAELRKWVHPQAAIHDFMSGHAESGADRGEQLILASEDSSPDSSDSDNWTWQGQDTAEYIIGDVLCNLRHAADALGIDFDAAARSGEWQYDEELADDARTEDEVESQPK